MVDDPAGGPADRARSSRSTSARPGGGAGRPLRPAAGGGDHDDGPPRDPLAAAKELVLGWLTLRPHTRAELAAKLHRREVDAEVAELALERLAEVGLVDDAAFAQAWVGSRHRGRGLARRALAAELRQRGVEPPTVAEALEAVDTQQEAATARALVDRRLRSLGDQPRDVAVRRLVGLLARKGYGAALVSRVVREAVEAHAGVVGASLGGEETDQLLATEDHRAEGGCGAEGGLAWDP